MTSWSENNAYRYNNRPQQQMSQQKREHVVREVRFASNVAEAAAVVTGYLGKLSTPH